MNELLKKVTASLGGAKNAGITALFILLGIALTLIGGSNSDLFKGTAQNGTEVKIEKLCEKVCSGDRVYVTVNMSPVGVVSGIAIVCNGGNQPAVKLNITKMLSTLYSIPSTQIYVTDFG